MDLLEESKRWHDNATALLQASHIEKLLADFGEVSFTGSYAYNLMLNSDIDMFVCNEGRDRQRADDMAVALIHSGFWNSVFYCDWETVPMGQYFCVKKDFMDHRWKVDIFLTTPEKLTESLPPREVYYEHTQEQKQTILELKVAKEKGLLPEDTESVALYDAVLKDGVKDADEFKARRLRRSED